MFCAADRAKGWPPAPASGSAPDARARCRLPRCAALVAAVRAGEALRMANALSMGTRSSSSGRHRLHEHWLRRVHCLPAVRRQSFLSAQPPFSAPDAIVNACSSSTAVVHSAVARLPPPCMAPPSRRRAGFIRGDRRPEEQAGEEHPGGAARRPQRERRYGVAECANVAIHLVGAPREPGGAAAREDWTLWPRAAWQSGGDRAPRGCERARRPGAQECPEAAAVSIP